MSGVKAFSIAAVLGGLGAGAVWTVPASQPGLHAGLKLGMTRQAALETVRDADPDAFVGQVCNGGLGVVGYVRHLGMEWMLMAHTAGDTVNEVVLYRNGHADARDWRQCEAAFNGIVVGHYKQRYSGAFWTARGSGPDGDARWSKVSGRLADGTPLTMEARRPDRMIAQCTFDVTYNAGARTRASVPD